MVNPVSVFMCVVNPIDLFLPIRDPQRTFSDSIIAVHSSVCHTWPAVLHD